MKNTWLFEITFAVCHHGNRHFHSQHFALSHRRTRHFQLFVLLVAVVTTISFAGIMTVFLTSCHRGTRIPYFHFLTLSHSGTRFPNRHFLTCGHRGHRLNLVLVLFFYTFKFQLLFFSLLLLHQPFLVEYICVVMCYTYICHSAISHT